MGVAGVTVSLVAAELLLWLNMGSLGFWLNIFPSIGLALLAISIASVPLAVMCKYRAARQTDIAKMARYDKAARYLQRHKWHYFWGAFACFVLAIGAQILWVVLYTP